MAGKSGESSMSREAFLYLRNALWKLDDRMRKSLDCRKDEWRSDYFESGSHIVYMNRYFMFIASLSTNRIGPVVMDFEPSVDLKMNKVYKANGRVESLVSQSVFNNHTADATKGYIEVLKNAISKGDNIVNFTEGLTCYTHIRDNKVILKLGDDLQVPCRLDFFNDVAWFWGTLEEEANLLRSRLLQRFRVKCTGSQHKDMGRISCLYLWSDNLTFDREGWNVQYEQISMQVSNIGMFSVLAGLVSSQL